MSVEPEGKESREYKKKEGRHSPSVSDLFLFRLSPLHRTHFRLVTIAPDGGIMLSPSSHFFFLCPDIVRPFF
jgi:hypothetical protein